MEQLVVTREAVEAYERRTGFMGMGEVFSAERTLCPERRLRHARSSRPPKIRSIFHNDST